MSRYDPLLERQLAKVGLGAGDPRTEGVTPTADQLADLLSRVSSTYSRSSEQRDQLARLLETCKQSTGGVMAERDRVVGVLAAVGDALSAMSAASRDPLDPVARFDAARGEWLSFLTELFDSDELVEADAATVQAAQALNRGMLSMVETLEHGLQSMSADRTLESDLAAAHRMLLPVEDVLDNGFVRIAGASEPAGACGGDFWAAYQLGDPGGADDKVVVLVGDVTGHGVPSTVLAAGARAACDLAWHQVRRTGEVSLGTFFEYANRAVHDIGRGQLMMTCIGGLFDASRKEVVLANAGHRLPLLVRAREAHPIVARGSPLGAAEAADCEPVTQPLTPDDIVVFYTDGLIETEDADGERFSERRLRSAAGGHYDPDPRVMRDGMLAELRAFRGGRPRTDDLTFVLARVRADQEDAWSSTR